MVLHPKRRYTAIASYLAPNTENSVPLGALTTETSDPIVTETAEYITTEN